MRQAMHEGVKATLHAVAGFPHRHPFVIAGVCIALAFAVFGAHIYSVQQHIEAEHAEIKRLIHHVSACGHRRASVR